MPRKKKSFEAIYIYKMLFETVFFKMVGDIMLHFKSLFFNKGASKKNFFHTSNNSTDWIG